MSAYKLPIATAFIFFPIIAFVFTLPFLIYQYRKYGSIPFLRSVIFYSFILYLLCAYFLVILPLPTIDEVKNLTTETTQLVPFDFIRQLSNTISFHWNELSSYLTIIKSPTFYIAAFNILLTLPFGVYLRYYFECKWHKIILYGFLLSLFFELTQLTGLYGIYPRPYRLFDVDDLIVIYDDMDIKVGHLKLKFEGSSGGHNGIKSIISNIGTQEFKRIRVGIGTPTYNNIDFVLSKPSKEEKELIEEAQNNAVDALKIAIKESFNKAMSLYNK